MSVCESCGKDIQKGNECMHADYTKTWLPSRTPPYGSPDAHGMIYHKSCYLKSLKKERKE